MTQENTANIKPDLNITEIASVYYHRNSDWKRTEFVPRGKDGLVLFLEGEIDYNFGEKHYTAKAGDILCFPGNIPYSGKKLSKGEVAFVVADFICSSRDEYRKLDFPIICEASDFEMYRNRFFELLRVCRENRLSSAFRAKSMLYDLIGMIYEDINLDCKRQSNREILDYIVANCCDAELHVSDICSKFFISESQLRRNILRAVGMTPNEYINSLRLDIARNELCYTDKTVKEIALGCGFSSQYYFSKSFVKHFGIPPSEYRKNDRERDYTVNTVKM